MIAVDVHIYQPEFSFDPKRGCPFGQPRQYLLERCFEFLEEAEVVLEVIAKVANLPFEHCDTLDTHSEGETAVLLTVNSRSLENVRVNHSAAHDLKPTCTLTDVTSLSTADVTAYVDLR